MNNIKRDGRPRGSRWGRGGQPESDTGREINKINYSNFFVTIVLDRNSRNKLPKFKYKVKKLVVGKINMSKKRNIAAKKFKSKYIAFIDSDAYPNKNWLRFAVKYLKQKKGEVVGGPGLD